jgi:hypothetical protein
MIEGTSCRYTGTSLTTAFPCQQPSTGHHSWRKQVMAALREVPRVGRQLLSSVCHRRPCAPSLQRRASTEATPPVIPDIETDSGLSSPIVTREGIQIVDPRKRASRRTHELPHERYGLVQCCSPSSSALPDRKCSHQSKIPLPCSQILSWSTASSTTASIFGPYRPRLQPWSLQPPSTEADIPVHHRL